MTFRVVLSDGTSAVCVALSPENARGIVEAALRDEPLDRGLTVVRIEASPRVRPIREIAWHGRD